jgi:SAM-dependent methyltransferase
VDIPPFPRRDPAEAGFWDLRYEARFAPWDAGKVPARLRAYVEGAGAPRRVLIPGCGSARDVAFLAAAGWNVVGIDFSAEAVALARRELGAHAERVRQADFFAPMAEAPFDMVAEAPFDMVYERAFLCALPRRLWADWGRRVGELIVPGGTLAGFFYFDEGERGPPFPLHAQAELDALLSPAFERLEDAAVGDSIPVFEGKERWQVWRRREA